MKVVGVQVNPQHAGQVAQARRHRPRQAAAVNANVLQYRHGCCVRPPVRQAACKQQQREPAAVHATFRGQHSCQRTCDARVVVEVPACTVSSAQPAWQSAAASSSLCETHSVMSEGKAPSAPQAAGSVDTMLSWMRPMLKKRRWGHKAQLAGSSPCSTQTPSRQCASLFADHAAAEGLSPAAWANVRSGRGWASRHSAGLLLFCSGKPCCNAGVRAHCQLGDAVEVQAVHVRSQYVPVPVKAACAPTACVSQEPCSLHRCLLAPSAAASLLCRAALRCSPCRQPSEISALLCVCSSRSSFSHLPLGPAWAAGPDRVSAPFSGSSRRPMVNRVASFSHLMPFQLQGICARTPRAVSRPASGLAKTGQLQVGASSSCMLPARLPPAGCATSTHTGGLAHLHSLRRPAKEAIGSHHLVKV